MGSYLWTYYGLVTVGGGIDLVPHGIKYRLVAWRILEQMLTYHQLGPAIFIWKQFHKIPQLPITGQPEYWIPFQSPRGQWVTSSPPWIRWQWPCNGVMQKYVIKWTLISKSIEYQYHTYEISHTWNNNNLIIANLYDAAEHTHDDTVLVSCPLAQ